MITRLLSLDHCWRTEPGVGDEEGEVQPLDKHLLQICELKQDFQYRNKYQYSSYLKKLHLIDTGEDKN